MIGEMKSILGVDFGKQCAFSEQQSTRNYSGHFNVAALEAAAYGISMDRHGHDIYTL